MDFGSRHHAESAVVSGVIGICVIKEVLCNKCREDLNTCFWIFNAATIFTSGAETLLVKLLQQTAILECQSSSLIVTF